MTNANETPTRFHPVVVSVFDGSEEFCGLQPDLNGAWVTWEAYEAILSSKDAEIGRLREVCSEVYQAFGAMSSIAGFFCTDDCERVMDNLSAAANGEPIPHADLLPWPKNELTQTGDIYQLEKANDELRIKLELAEAKLRGREWIPVSERLPEEDNLVEVWVASYYQRKGGNDFAVYKSGEWHNFRFNQSLEVTHWKEATAAPTADEVKK